MSVLEWSRVEVGGGAYIGGEPEVTSDRRAGGSSSRRMGDCEWECEKGIPVLACVDIVVILCERLKNFGRVFGSGYAEIRVSLLGRRDAWRGFNAREHWSQTFYTGDNSSKKSSGSGIHGYINFSSLMLLARGQFYSHFFSFL